MKDIHLAGITPIKSLPMISIWQQGRRGRSSRFIERIRGSRRKSEKGIKIAVETIQKLKEIKSMSPL
jgi:hypothetical protein